MEDLRNDPERIRHIRGILIDDDPEIKKVVTLNTKQQQHKLFRV